MSEEYTSERLQAPWQRRSDCIQCGASNPHDAPCCWKCGGQLENDVEYYAGTDIETVVASNPISDELELAVGIVDEIAGKRFGRYADCGIVHTEEK